MQTKRKGTSIMSDLMKEYFEKNTYINELEDLIKYQYAYDIFMEYFDELPDDVKPKLHKRLEGLGL